MGIFAVYDTVGIQDYIFSTNKLSENVGASKLVANIFAELLPNIIKDYEGQSDWKEREKLGVVNGQLSVSAEMVFQGGGNAFVAFQDDAAFQKITKEFLIKVNQRTSGVGIAVAAVETNFGDTYKADYAKLMRRLNLAKGNFNIPVPAGNLPITKQSARTGLPVTCFKEDEYIDEAQRKKRAFYHFKKDENEIKEFEQLVAEKNENSFIAVIHADGNNMGNSISKLMANQLTYEKAVPAMRELSKEINDCFELALSDTVTAFENWFEKQEENKSKKSPYIELISDGDDLTVVTGGKYALSFAAMLLRNIEKAKSPFGEGSTLSACAGVVIFHSHYPFSEAYKLAEECCSNAKKYLRSLELSSQELSYSYLDFHLHQSGRVANLDVLREKQYKSDGKELFMRPWCITADVLPNFSEFERLQKEWVNKNWVRSRLKSLRNAIGTSEKQAEIIIAQSASRGYTLPQFNSKISDTKIPETKSKYAPYFDILELADVYEKIEEADKSAN